jgi:ribosomal protein S18 acetylase RimI-like enzyme
MKLHSDPTFRLAVAADSAALGEFMARNFLDAYGHCSTPENVQAAVEEHYGEPAQLRQIADPGRWNLVALVDGECAGHAQLREVSEAPEGAGPPPVIELSRFYVDTRFHGRGIAQAMMAQVKQQARERGARSIYLSVWQEQPQAIRFYTKEGFRIAGTLVFVVGDDPKDDWLMRHDLA